MRSVLGTANARPKSLYIGSLGMLSSISPGPAIAVPGPSGLVISKTPIIDKTTSIRAVSSKEEIQLTTADPLNLGEPLREKVPAQDRRWKRSTTIYHPKFRDRQVS